MTLQGKLRDSWHYADPVAPFSVHILMEGFPVYSIAQLAREFLPRRHPDTGVYRSVANHKACPMLQSWQVHAVVLDETSSKV